MATEKIDLNNLDKSDWKTYRFDEIAQNISERVDPNNTDLEVYIGLEHIDSESLHIKRHGTPDDVNGIKLKFYKDDIIFGRRRAYQRKAGIATCDGFCSAHALVVRANPDVIDPALFPFFIHSDLFMNRAVDISVGSLSPTINWGTLKHQEFKIPPIEKQKDFAELLWSIDHHINTEKKLEEALDYTRESYIKSSLLKYRSGIEPDLPAGYEIKRLDELADISGGSTPSRSNDSFWDGDIPWLTPTDVTKHEGIHLSKTKEYITKEGLKDISNRVYPPGSILFCSRATIGFAVINDIEMATNQGFSNFICNGEVSNYFLYFMLQHVTPELTRLAGGSTFLEISKSSMRSFKVVVPDKMNLEVIESKLLHFDKINREISKKISNSSVLRSNLINQVF